MTLMAQLNSPRQEPVLGRAAHQFDLRYRKDIDGLRSLAVIPVVLYHVGFTFFRGGFIGVDVFFVISGFLITQILNKEIVEGTFSVIRFYDRRIRRIFPALFATLLFTLLGAVLYMLPSELVDFGRSLVASIAFCSNLYFLSESDYFNVALQNSPLLHTWSLAVEEQYYIFFPIILYALKGLGRRRQWLALFGIAAFSFILSVFLVRASLEQVAFYLLPARAWELLIGALLALELVPVIRALWIREILAGAGVILILLSSVIYHDHMPFPGATALAPCCGAAFIIYAGQYHPTMTGRILSLRPLAFTGLISYSLYLWHWPIIAFAHLQLVGPFTLAQKVAIVLVSYLAAIASWRFVETPFRRRQLLTTAIGLRTIATAGMIVFVLAGSTLSVISRTLPWYTPEIIGISDYIHYNDRYIYRRGQCFIDSHSISDRHYDLLQCASIDPARPNVLLMGDSHAAHLWKGLSVTRQDTHFLEAAASGCKPVYNGRGEPACVKLMNEMLLELIPSGRIQGVILSAEWIKSDIPALISTVDKISSLGPTVYVSGPIVEYEQSLPRILSIAIIDHDPSLLVTGRRAGIEEIDDQIRAALRGHHAIYISPYRALCGVSTKPCAVYAKGAIPMQWDYGHLTADGSIYLAKIISKDILNK